MVRPSGQESLQLHNVLQPLLVPLNPRSGVEPCESDAERRVSHSHDRVLQNLAPTHTLSKFHVQSVLAPNRTDCFVHRLSFGRNFTLQLFLELRRWIDWNRFSSNAHLLISRIIHGYSNGQRQQFVTADSCLSDNIRCYQSSSPHFGELHAKSIFT